MYTYKVNKEEKQSEHLFAIKWFIFYASVGFQWKYGLSQIMQQDTQLNARKMFADLITIHT